MPDAFAYTDATIMTMIQQSLGPSISADSAKVAAIENEIDMAWVEAKSILGPSSTSSDTFNLLWSKLAMYRGSVVAVGITEETLHLYKVYHDYLELLTGDKLSDTTTVTSAR